MAREMHAGQARRRFRHPQAASAPLSYGDDGSVEIVIQHDQTEATSNWLPAPAEPFYMALRESSSGPEMLSRTWLPPLVDRVT